MNEERLIHYVDRAKAGDSEALSELISATQGRLFRFCIFLAGDRQRAEDLTQDAFVMVLERIKDLKDSSGFMAWLFRAAKNRHLDVVKSGDGRAMGSHKVELEDSCPEQSAGFDRILEIRTALSQLETDDQLVLLLVDLEGCSYREAAEVIGVSENALRSRLYRARQSFEKIFFKDETKGSSQSSST